MSSGLLLFRLLSIQIRFTTAVELSTSPCSPALHDLGLVVQVAELQQAVTEATIRVLRPQIFPMVAVDQQQAGFLLRPRPMAEHSPSDADRQEPHDRPEAPPDLDRS